MRASELLGCDVYDRGGAHLGRVHDLRFEKRPSAVGHGTCYRLTGFECGAAPLGHRLGYGRPEMKGPWLFKATFGMLSRRSVVVDWSDIARIDRPRVQLRRGRRALDLSRDERA
jgi:hypothetical protein